MTSILDWTWDVSALALTPLVAIALQRGAALAAKRYWISRTTARKLVHVGLGCWSLPLVAMIRHPVTGAVIIGGLMIVNYHGNVKRLQRAPKRLRLISLISHVLAFALLSAAWWSGRTDAVIAGILGMSIGDAAAALVGIRASQRPGRKTIQGTLANFTAVSLLAIIMLLALPHPLWPRLIACPSLGMIAALIERRAPGPIDNPLLLIAIGGAWWLLI